MEQDRNAGKPANTTESSERIFDREALLIRTLNSMELATELVQMCLHELPQDMSAIRDEIDRGDSPGLSKSAHTLKGVLGNLSAEAACEAALALEIIGRQGALDRAAAAYSSLEYEINRLQPMLTAFLGADCSDLPV
ncbi:MAG: Hpt domain-containing protein [Deltaproteobacteria bacterium]|nr:Hpt domain-containing protein [Deltaproteobacteria bacterium]